VTARFMPDRSSFS